MLKKSLIIIFAVIFVFALGFGVNQWITNHEKQQTLKEQEIKERVQTIYGGEVKTLMQNGNEYEVEFENEFGTYVVALNRNSGEITSLSLKKLNEKREQREKNAKIGKRRAVEIALTKVKGEVDDVELEMFDGSYVYVVEIESEEDDAIVYVQAYTGEILHVTLE